MYESFYRLKEKPFSLLPDTDYLYPSRKHGTALALLEYCLLRQEGFCVIWGEAGVGKTTLIRRLLSQHGDRITIGLISNTQGSLGELLGWVAVAFGLECQGRTRSQLYEDFRQFVADQQARKRQTVLVIDEAQNISAAMASELRVLSKVGASPDQSLKTILVGQPQLRATLRAPGLEQFARQIVVDYYLGPLDRDETGEYIRYRLTVAGGDPDIFDDEARDAVFHYSGGVPRLINLLCDNALARACATGRALVEAEVVHVVMREREAHGMLPQFAPWPGADGSQQKVFAMAGPSAAEFPAARRSAVAASMPEAGPAQAEMNDKGVHPQDPAFSKLVSLEGWPYTERHAAMGRRVVRPARGRPGQASSGTRPSVAVRDDPAVPQAGPGSGVEDRPRSFGPGDSASSELAAAGPQRGEGMTNYRMVPLATDRRLRTSWGVAILLGFVAGLLVAAILIGSVYLDLGKVVRARQPRTPVAVRRPVVPAPPVAPPPVPTVIPAAASPVSRAGGDSEERARLRELRNERDAAIAEARALQRERDAALAVAKARERAAQAELRAALEEERAQAALRRRADRELVRVSSAKFAVPPAPKRIDEAAPALRHPVRPPAESGAPESRSLKFSPNPCNGPAAKFLSTCKE